MNMLRYLRLLRVQVKAAVLLALQYRADFFMEVVMALLWSGTALVPLYVLFSIRDGVRGWSAEEMLVVVGFFTILKGVLASVIQPSLSQAVEHIRKGTLDFLLLKPADAQFLLSTSKLELANLADVFTGFAIIGWALAHLPRRASLFDFAFAAVLLACALAILYAMWILVVSLAFRVVKIDNMNHLIVSLFEAARWPSSIFRGALALVFTFVIPLALLTTYPALALLGKAGVSHLATAVGVAIALIGVSRVVWTRAIRSYAGASA
jgi:ABC-2 type transport system permease protein